MDGHKDRNSRLVLFDVLDFRGIRHDWFAGKVGLSKSFLSQIKNGTAPFPRARRAVAAEVLGVPEALLFLPSGSITVEELAIAPETGVA